MLYATSLACHKQLQTKSERVCVRERERERERETERDRENSNSENLFYKDCSLGSVKNLSNN